MNENSLKQTEPISDDKLQNIINSLRIGGIKDEDLMKYIMEETKGQENPKRIVEFLKSY